MSKIRRVIVHIEGDGALPVLADRVSRYHADVIERRLRQSDLSVDQKIAVLDRVIGRL